MRTMRRLGREHTNNTNGGLRGGRVVNLQSRYDSVRMSQRSSPLPKPPSDGDMYSQGRTVYSNGRTNGGLRGGRVVNLQSRYDCNNESKK